MDVVVEHTGQAAKRGIIPRLPTGLRLLADLEAWLRSEYADAVRSTRPTEPGAGVSGIAVRLHPGAPELTLTADDLGRVAARAVVSYLGAGYETFVRRLLERAGEDLEIAWDTDQVALADGGVAVGRGSAVAEASSGLSSDRRARAERDQLTWLGLALAGARSSVRRGAGGIHLGIEPGIRFDSDAAIVTPLGPRDEAWLERAADDPRVAIEICPWWLDATDARYLLNRALCLMWTEVRWRPPVDDADRAAVDEALNLLKRAYPLDPALPFPWHEWQELIDLRGSQTVVTRPDAMGRQVAERAGADVAPFAPIGYRRRDVTIVHQGWRLVVPGTYADRRMDEEWTGWEGGRRITIAATETGDERGPMRPQAFLAQVAGDFGDEAIRHEDGDLVGVARLTAGSEDGISVGLLEGFSAVLGSGAAIRIEFHDAADWSWAIEQWRALSPMTRASDVRSQVRL
ncbi:MAG TPA: hypothetical protein VGK63_07470 [Candidatus Limnocylindrales bacterium]